MKKLNRKHKFKNNRTRMLQMAGVVVVIAVIVVVVVALVVVAAIKGWEYTNSNAFCANACHNVHPEETVTIQTSKHAQVTCVECHMGRIGTIRTMIKKVGHFKHIFPVIFQTYGRPVFAESYHSSDESCEGCHNPLSPHGDTLREIKHYLPDESNTEKRTFFTMKVGGGEQGKGLSDGSHWHIVNKVKYIASDERKQEILKVIVTKLDGTTKEYEATGAAESIEEVEDEEWHTMDCLDCHNQIGHPFTTPEKALDEALADGRISRGLPFIKSELISLFTSGYESQEEAFSALEAFEQRYKETYPEVEIVMSDEFEKAMDHSKGIVSLLIFEKPGISWESFLDNSGHKNFKGCFRCHDGRHVSEEGEMIPLRCGLCHSIPVTVDEGDEPPLIRAGSLQTPSSHMEPDFIFNHPILANEVCGACHGTIDYGSDDSSFCSSSACHGSSWEPFKTLEAMDHPFSLEHGHEKAVCYECHRGEEKPSDQCTGCHKPSRNHFTTACDECHSPEGWQRSSAVVTAQANKISHSLEGMDDCLMCHGPDEGVLPAPAGHRIYNLKQCTLCHK